MIRDAESKPFDYLIAVIFNEDFSVRNVWKMPIGTVLKYAKFSQHQNGMILRLTDRMLKDEKVVDILDEKVQGK